ncbi:protein phosphatase, putative [Entamoeba nuttalli P19]|uniref:protein-serine/threonine phosphatase n=1 Tax=Entamoeba nuttalli (strain P19) TaxID=1076696 RepID=K2H2F5_ENTNP|nr:protein phosphatase, putative [Entamoeba nuttalli P19]EKE40497.1 protein phosphatase, putative [Entamoeba nuttalli P19]|eukprot:XP_008857171.1 protein phosphatase, putative [Entamoeba nuttalli P19]
MKPEELQKCRSESTMGEFQSTPTTEQHSGIKKIPNAIVGYSSMQGWRKTMEDAHLITDLLEDKGLIGIYDGHGGIQASQYCANEMKKTLLNSPHFPSSIQESLTETYLSLDSKLKTPEGSKMLADICKTENYDNQMLVNGSCEVAKDIGSTALTLVINENEVVIANVGDCRCLLLKNDNEILQLTTDQKPNVKSEVDRIVSCGGVIRNGRVNGNLSLTRAIGDLQFKKGNDVNKYIISPIPEITTYELEGNEDFLVLACDGIWDVLSNEDVVSIIKEGIESGLKLNEICEQILKKCLSENPYEAPGFDNMTLIVAVFDRAENKWRRCCPGGDVIS